MKNYFFKINGKYIESFSKNILSRFRNNEIRSNSSLLKSIFIELNELFKHIGGKVSSKEDIQKPTDYPDSSKFNKLILNIDDDLRKLFTAQKLIEDDVNNLLNFNSMQRTKTFENLTSTQQEVYSIYVKNKKGIIIPSNNPFESSDNKDDGSKDVYIDQTRGVLTLDYKSSTEKTADIENIDIFFAGKIPQEPIYPNNKVLGIGHHWKLPGAAEDHFIDSKNKSQVLTYKNMMIDYPDNSLGVGWCEFESVVTNINTVIDFDSKRSYRLTDNNDGTIGFTSIISANPYSSIEEKLKNYIGSMYLKDSQLVWLDVNNSLQGKYVNQSVVPIVGIGDNIAQYKLVIPFHSSTPSTNEIFINFEPDTNGYYPKINWSKSVVYSDQNGSDDSYGLIMPADNKLISENGEYSCMIQGGFIKPSRMELFLEYGSDELHWYPIGFYMTHYMYNASQTYSLINNDGENIRLILSKTYDIFVDTEADIESEKTRAINVLLARGR